MLKIKPALAFTLLALAVMPVASSSAAVGDPVLDPEEQALCTQINQYRADNGVAPLRVSIMLSNASDWMSNDMAAKNYFSHTDSIGRTFSTRTKAFGYTFMTTRGENLAAGNETASGTFNQWRNSAGHNANMLSSSYKVIGISHAYSPLARYKHYWTSDFGAYADQSVAC
jgi:uncharacterized protein YkwD